MDQTPPKKNLQKPQTPIKKTPQIKPHKPRTKKRHRQSQDKPPSKKPNQSQILGHV
jgi:hypothetical protein